MNYSEDVMMQEKHGMYKMTRSYKELIVNSKSWNSLRNTATMQP